MNALYDVRWRSGRCNESVPVIGDHARIHLFDGRRYIGQGAGARPTRYSDRAQRAGADVLQHDRHIENAHIDLPTDQVSDRGRRAFVRHVDHIDLRFGFQ